ncbi:MAG: RidA family protein [Candidatus Cloacimonetes bacterium]|nr:RidA family protein [Candidatus Cloacimonadota bacterium]NLO11796.1 RidA family protein [Candidatus Cloacimonadota bacterium]
MKAISTTLAAAAVGPYSQAAMSENILFISGQLGINPETQEMEDGFEAQAKRVFKSLEAILKEAGLGFDNVVKVSVFLQDMNDFAQLNAIYATHFTEPFPAREAIEVARLPKDGLVEISLIAVRPS